MTFLERVAECRNWRPAHYRPFVVAGATVGQVRDGLLPALSRHADVLALDDGAVRLRDGLADCDARSRALAPVARSLAAAGFTLPLTGERYAVSVQPGTEVLLTLDRAAVPAFGVRAHGVHLNGYLRRRDGLHLWIARRSASRATFPGLLDNMVAGGQPLGLTSRETLLKECAEEAGLDAALASRALATGEVRYRHEGLHGLKDDVLHLFELELPDDVRPVPRDGEVEAFELWPVARALDVVAHTRDFKFNCPLAILHFALRHGAIPPSHPEERALREVLGAR